jgi:hypothetical protein
MLTILIGNIVVIIDAHVIFTIGNITASIYSQKFVLK